MLHELSTYLFLLTAGTTQNSSKPQLSLWQEILMPLRSQLDATASYSSWADSVSQVEWLGLSLSPGPQLLPHSPGSTAGFSSFFCSPSRLLVLPRSLSEKEKPCGWNLPPISLFRSGYLSFAPASLGWAPTITAQDLGTLHSSPFCFLSQTTQSIQHCAFCKIISSSDFYVIALSTAGPTLHAKYQEICISRAAKRCKVELEVVILEATSWIPLLKVNVLYLQTVSNIHFYHV